jgi:hypothetical protein
MSYVFAHFALCTVMSEIYNCQNTKSALLSSTKPVTLCISLHVSTAEGSLQKTLVSKKHTGHNILKEVYILI